MYNFKNHSKKPTCLSTTWLKKWHISMTLTPCPPLNHIHTLNPPRANHFLELFFIVLAYMTICQNNILLSFVYFLMSHKRSHEMNPSADWTLLSIRLVEIHLC